MFDILSQVRGSFSKTDEKCIKCKYFSCCSNKKTVVCAFKIFNAPKMILSNIITKQLALSDLKIKEEVLDELRYFI